jgi:hypothetical protein
MMKMIREDVGRESRSLKRRREWPGMSRIWVGVVAIEEVGGTETFERERKNR